MGRRIHRDLYRHRPWAGQRAGMVVCRAADHRNRGARRRRGQAAAQAALDPGDGLPRACRAGRASVDRAALVSPGCWLPPWRPRNPHGARTPATRPVNTPGRMSCQPDTRLEARWRPPWRDAAGELPARAARDSFLLPAAIRSEVDEGINQADDAKHHPQECQVHRNPVCAHGMLLRDSE